MAAGDGGSGAVVAGLLTSAATGVAALVAAAVTGSRAVLAVGVLGVVLAADQGLLLLGSRRARREADERHPFGYGRERVFWSFALAPVLFVLGGLLCLRAATDALPSGSDFERLEAPAVGLAVLALAAVAAGVCLRAAARAAREPRGSRSWWRFVRTARTPELPVLLLQDLAALLALLVALAGLALTAATGDGAWDALAAGAVGLLLLALAVLTVVEMRGLLIGEAASREDLEAIRVALVGEGVTGVIHLRTQHLGPDELLVGAKIALQPGSSLEQVAAAIDAAEARVRRVVPIARVMYLEPDIPWATPAAR